MNIPKGGAIIASNHLSFLDPPVIAVTFKKEEIHFLARESLFKGFLGYFISRLNAHPVKAFNRELFKEAVKILKLNGKILIFPEGTRSSDGSFGKIKPGVELIANLSSSPILPVYIHGTKEIWGRDRKFPKFSGKIICHIGKPISPHKEIGLAIEKAWKELSACS